MQKRKKMSKNLKETKEFLGFVFSLVYASARSLEDGKFTVGDLPKFGGVIRKLNGGVRGIEQIPGELADLTQDEVLELQAFIKEEFNLTNEVLEEQIESVINVASELAFAIVGIKDGFENK
jgi:hypothetical protein